MLLETFWTTDCSLSSSALKLGPVSVAFSLMRTLAQLLSICRCMCPRFAAALFNPHPNTVLESLPTLSLLSYLRPGYPNSPSPWSQFKRHGSISIIPNQNLSQCILSAGYKSVFIPWAPWDSLISLYNVCPDINVVISSREQSICCK